MTEVQQSTFPLPDGTVYSQRKNFTPFSVSAPDSYTHIIGSRRMERLYDVASRLKGRKVLEINSSAQGGGVAEMLFSAIPFLNALGIEAEWKVISGNPAYYECTKGMHNLLQGMPGSFTPQMEQTYLDNLQECATPDFIDFLPDVVTVHDPQPLCLTHYIKKNPGGIWLWRCHIDIEEEALRNNVSLFDLINDCVEHYDAAIFSAAHYVVSQWPMPKFIIPPFIDPLSEKNRELSRAEIDKVLDTYGIDASIPIIAQVGRFDPWKGIDRTIAAYREVRKERRCQLILAGGLAADDPEGNRILADVIEQTRKEPDIHVLNLSMANRLENWREVNALQRAADIIMQPSTKEGFGLVITEALWKSKPVIAADVGGIPLQIREGDTGYFYRTPRATARKIIHLLDNPQAAEALGARGRQYVTDHFMLPDRIADYLLAIELAISGGINKKTCSECIISYHPWFKLAKR